MWVIIRWIRTNAYPLLALILFSFSFNLVLRYQLYQHSYYFNQSVSFFRNVDQFRTDFTVYMGLRKENEYLKNENAQLRQQLIQRHPQRYQSYDTIFTDTALPKTQQPTYTYMPAEVVRNTTNKRDNYFYINQGTNHGIQNGMAVLSPKGVAGVIVTTSGNFSRVMSVLHSDFELTPFIPDLNLRQGVVKWEGTDARFGYLKEVNRTEDVKKGQWILSSNYSSIFPPNIPVGRVVTSSKPLQQQYQQIKIEFATDFHRLHYVYCVKNHVKTEIDALNTPIQP